MKLPTEYSINGQWYYLVSEVDKQIAEFEPLQNRVMVASVEMDKQRKQIAELQGQCNNPDHDTINAERQETKNIRAELVKAWDKIAELQGQIACPPSCINVLTDLCDYCKRQVREDYANRPVVIDR